MSIVKTLQDDLKNHIGSLYCIPTSTGTQAMIAALDCYDFPKDSEIIIPDFTCYWVLLAVYFSGLKPVPVDVSLDNCNLSPEEVKSKVSKKTRAIITVHGFGQSYDIKKINAISEEYKLILIEDFAQGFGGKAVDYGKFGTLGDVSVTSFGQGKILNAGGGGALFTSDKTIYYELLKYFQNKNITGPWKYKPERVRSQLVDRYLSKFQKRHINAYPLANFVFKTWYFLKKDGFWPLMNNRIERLISTNIKYVKMHNELRFKKAELYDKKLSCENIIKPKYDTNGTLINYNIRCPEHHRNGLINSLNKHFESEKVILSYYPPLHRYLHMNDDEYPNSTTLSRSIVNLPLDLSTSVDDIKIICNGVNGYFESVVA